MSTSILRDAPDKIDTANEQASLPQFFGDNSCIFKCRHAATLPRKVRERLIGIRGYILKSDESMKTLVDLIESGFKAS